MNICYNVNMTSYDKIIYSDRKTLAITVDSDGKVIVRAPKKFPLKKIKEFIAKKERWINEKKERVKNAKKFELDSNVFVFGDEYKIIETDGITRLDGKIFYLPKDKKHDAFLSLLYDIAKEKLTLRTKYLASRYSFSYNMVKISFAKSYWGLCSASNVITYTAFLVLCPKDVIDYVILHELCHTVIKNHQKEFWKLVESRKALYKVQDDKLKQYSYILKCFK